ncbi:MAG: FxLYD domain-containing protein [Armatimonadota bacterium]
MTFADWLILVERTGVPVNGIDPNWLEHQFQLQQQPALVAHMIQNGQAPRMMGHISSLGKSKRSGCGGPATSIIVGIFGFILIIGGILFGLKYLADHNLGVAKQNVDPTSVVSNIPEVPQKTLIEKGLDPKLTYPYWPLVYDLTGMKADKDTISGKVTNYGEKSVTTLTIEFGLFTATHEKVGTAQDQIASLGPGETWSYSASVKGINYDDCRLDSITFK